MFHSHTLFSSFTIFSHCLSIVSVARVSALYCCRSGPYVMCGSRFQEVVVLLLLLSSIVANSQSLSSSSSSSRRYRSWCPCFLVNLLIDRVYCISLTLGMGVRRWYISDWSMMRNGLRPVDLIAANQRVFSAVGALKEPTNYGTVDSLFSSLSLSVFYPVAAAAATANVRVFLFSFFSSVVWCVWYTLRMLYLLNIFSLLLIAAKGNREREREGERAKKGTRGLLISSLLRSAKTGFCSSAVSSARALLRFKNRDRGTYSDTRRVYFYTLIYQAV